MFKFNSFYKLSADRAEVFLQSNVNIPIVNVSATHTRSHWCDGVFQSLFVINIVYP